MDSQIAGLAISERMDALSMLETAKEYLESINSSLLRMRELAVIKNNPNGDITKKKIMNLIVYYQNY